MVVGIGLLWGIWQSKAWIRYGLLGAGASFVVWYWCDRLFLQTQRANWPFMLGTTVLLLIFVTICVAHPRTKAFFTKRESYDR